MVKDPVREVDVDPKTISQTSTYQGRTYYFCSPGCKKAFDQEPQKYTVDVSSSRTEHHS